ncbi:MAG TPA: hypothetical protein VJA87_01640 [Candidatus Paceibacterota bacterium]
MHIQAIQQTHLYAFLIGAAFLIASFIPLTAAAASKRPTCSLNITTEAGEAKITKDGDIIVLKGEEFEVKWTGKNAEEAELNGEEIDVSDSDEFAPTKATTYEFVFKSGSRKATCEVTAHVVEAEIETTSAKKGKPTIKGTADGLKKVNVGVYTEKGKKVFEKKNVSVRRGNWSVRSSKTLKDGEYEIRLMGEKKYELNEIMTGKLTIGEGEKDSENGDDSDGIISVSTLPLLSGGTIRAGETKPVSYLYLRNTGKEAVRVTGFDVKQNGTANASAITGLSTVDDKGGSRGASSVNPFKNGIGFAPTNAVIEPGALKLFTIKATLGTNISIGTNLKLDVTGIKTNGSEKATFPLRGTTWTIGG